MKQSINTLTGAALSLALVACSAVSAPDPARAQTQQPDSAAGSDIKVMVMMEDTESAGLKLGADTTVGQAAISAIKDNLQRYGYQVIDQNTVAQVLGFKKKEEGGYTRAQLKELAKRAKAAADRHPEFDIRGLVIFSVFPRLEETTVDKDLVLQISGEIHDAENNQFLGKFGPKTKAYQVASDCAGSACISMVGRQAASEVAAVVSHEARARLAKLTKDGGMRSAVHGRAPAPVPGPGAGTATEDAGLAGRPRYSGLVTDYAVHFEHIPMNEVFQIKRVMDEEFPGVVPGGKIQGSDPVIHYRYRSRAPQDKLYEWFHQLLYQMGYNVGQDVLIDMEGKSFTIKLVGSDLPRGPARLGPFN